MAVFNPETPNAGAPDFTGASRGAGANRAFEALFSGVGDAISQGVQTADTFVQNKIEDEARFGFEEQNKDLGLDAGVTPSELTQSQEGLATLALAMEQGKVTPEYYYQRLTTTMKSLRAKYPGYEKEVDKIVQEVTGTRPANAFRDQLFQNLAQAQSDAKSQASKDETFIRQNGDLLWGNEQNLPNDQKIELITRRQGVAGKWNYDASIAKNSDELQQRNAEVIANQTAADAISSIGDSAGLGSGNFIQVLQNAVSKPLTPEQLAGVNTSLVTAKSAVANQIRQQILQRYPNISGTRLQEMINSATSQFDMIQTELNSGRYDMAARIATSNKLEVDTRTQSLMTQFPELKTIMSINNTVGGQAGGELFSRYIQQGYGGNAGFAEKLLSFGMAQSTAQGVYSVHDLSKAVAENQQMKGSEKGNLLKGFLDGFSETASQVGNENIGNFVKKNYTESSGESVLWSESGVVPNDEKVIVFNKLFDPKISKKIQESGDSEAQQQYLNTALDRFQSVPEYKKAASALQEWLPELKKYYNVGYDEKTNQITITDNGQTDNSPTAARTRQAFNKVLSKLNQGMATMGPVLDAGGMSRSEGMKRVFQDLHLDFDTSAAGQGFWEWMIEGLSKPVNTSGVDIEGSRMNLGLEGEPPLGTNNEDEDAEDDISFQFKTPGGASFKPMAKNAQGQEISDEKGNPRIIRQGAGLANLVTSTKRGYQPDVDNLRPEISQGISDLQQAWGRDIPIISAYRDPARNARAGGAKKSQHMHGNAVDVDVSDLSIKERQDLIKLARSQGFTGVGVYRNSLHLDKGALRAWGPSYRSTSIPKWALAALE